MSVPEKRDKRTRHIVCHLPQLSADLSRLVVCVAVLSKVRKPGRNRIGGSGYTDYLSGRPHGRLQEATAAVARRFVTKVGEITPLDERMRLGFSLT